MEKKKEVGQKTDIPLEKAKELFFHSFRFSQGAPLLQVNIFLYLSLVHPEWTISQERLKELATGIRDPIRRFVGDTEEVQGRNKILWLHKPVGNVESDIAFQLGYSSLAHLSGQFKKVTGQTMKDYHDLKVSNRLGFNKL